jgi:broad specificity phosphatase PhoE
MKLYILRHGDAGDRGDPRYPNDADRPLTSKGTRRTEALAARKLDITFDVILSSPFVRARGKSSTRLRLQACSHRNLGSGFDVEELVHEVNTLGPRPTVSLSSDTNRTWAN